MEGVHWTLLRGVRVATATLFLMLTVLKKARAAAARQKV
jgi:hypothetical protein